MVHESVKYRIWESREGSIHSVYFTERLQRYTSLVFIIKHSKLSSTDHLAKLFI